MYGFHAFSHALTSDVGYDLAQSVEVDALEGDTVEVLPSINKGKELLRVQASSVAELASQPKGHSRSRTRAPPTRVNTRRGGHGPSA